MDEKQVLVYEASDGNVPFSDWLSSLHDRQGMTRIIARIGRIRVGNLGDWRSVGDGVAGLKIDCGPGYRVYFGRLGERVVLLLCGGDKRTQAGDIRKAKSYWADYRRRNDESEQRFS